MPDPTNLTGLKKSPIIRIRGLKDRLVYPNKELTPENCVVVSNINFSERGIAASRGGKEKFNTTQIPNAEPVLGFRQANFKAGSQKLFCTPDKVYTDDGTTRKDITGSLSHTGGNDVHFPLEFLDDQIFGCNGIDAPFVWAGDFATPTAAAALSFAADSTQFTTCEGFVAHRNTLVVLSPTISGVKQTTRILWADVDTRDFGVDTTRYLNNNRYEIGGIGSSEIIGGVDNWDKLWVMKSDGVYPGRLEFRTGHIEYVPDEEVGALKGVSPVAKSSFLARPDFIFGIAKEGAFIVRPNGQFGIVTKDIDFDGLFNRSRLQYAIATTRDDDHQVRVLMSSKANTQGHDKILVWDWETGDVSIEDYSNNLLSWISRYDDNGTEQDLHASNSLGYMYTANVGDDDDGKGIAWEIEMAPYDMGLAGVDKTIHSIVTYYRDVGAGLQAIQIEMQRDEGTRSSRTKNSQIGTDLQYDEGRTYDSGLIYPGGGNDSIRWGVNRTAQSLSMRWSGSSIVKLVGYQVFFTIDDTDINTPL